jgi:glycerol-3-phosphate dehydrogenase (NAD(P)+)
VRGQCIEGFRAATECLSSFSGVVVSVTKGIEFETGNTMSDILKENSPKARIVAMSGPTLATKWPKACPLPSLRKRGRNAAPDCANAFPQRGVSGLYQFRHSRRGTGRRAQERHRHRRGRVCDGLGFGDNSKAALVTRAIAEMRRLGVACGAQADTFTGLSGLGDLMVTCFSRLSRNRGFGERLGKGEKPRRLSRA